MNYESREAISEYLKEHRHFEECILHDVRWEHYGTVIALDFDYIWTTTGEARPEYGREQHRDLTLHNVQEFAINNAMTEYMALHPAEINWGFSEVAAVRVVEDSAMLRKYHRLPIPLHHLRCQWEGARRIDVVFSTLEAD
jgi:hypothetical protein